MASPISPSVNMVTATLALTVFALTNFYTFKEDLWGGGYPWGCSASEPRFCLFCLRVLVAKVDSRNLPQDPHKSLKVKLEAVIMK